MQHKTSKDVMGRLGAPGVTVSEDQVKAWLTALSKTLALDFASAEGVEDAVRAHKRISIRPA